MTKCHWWAFVRTLGIWLCGSRSCDTYISRSNIRHAKKKVNTDEYSGIRRVTQLDTGKKTGNNYVHLTKTAAQACDP